MGDARRAADRHKLHAYWLWVCAVPVPDIAAHLGRSEDYAARMVTAGQSIETYRPRYARDTMWDVPFVKTYPHRRKAGRNAAIVAARASGRTLDSIAREHGITRERVRQILAKYGAPAGE